MWGRVLASRATTVRATLPALPGRAPISDHGFELSHGRLARLAAGSALLRAGPALTLLATVTRDTRRAHQGAGASLLVDFRAKAAGKGIIPATFLRREMQPAAEETLTARVVDRALRPALHPEAEGLQVCVSQLAGRRAGADACVDALAVNAASAALLTDGALAAPVGAARACIVDGDCRPFPTDDEAARAAASALVAVVNGRIVACTLRAGREGVSNADAVRLLRATADAAQVMVAPQLELALKTTELREHEGHSAFPRQMPRSSRTDLDEPSQSACADWRKTVHEIAYAVYIDAFVECRKRPGKAHRAAVVTAAQQAIVDAFPDAELNDVLSVASAAARIAHRDVLIRDGLRIDGRRVDEVRHIRCEPTFLGGDVHGSALFERGDTQVLALATIGLGSMAKKSEDYIGQTGERKRFFVHYSFPPFATGEAGRFAGAMNRREIGHSALAEHAISAMLELGDAQGDEQEYPYVIRMTAEVMASDGSSSMATVCAGSLALQDAGVPLKKPVAGVAMGLVTGPEFENGDDESDDYILLTDLLGAEDHFGSMDLKVAGAADAVTALQLDVKGSGVPLSVIEKALDRAELARGSILEQMREAATGLREAGDMPLHAPRSEMQNVDSAIFARTMLRNGAAGLRDIERSAGVELSFDGRKGVVQVNAPDAASAEKAAQLIGKALGDMEIGTKITMRAKEVRASYAVVECIHQPIEGLLHVSKMQTRGASPTAVEEGVVKEGRFPDARHLLKKGDVLDCVVLECDREKGVLRVGLTAPPPRTKGKSVAQTVDDFLEIIG